MQHIHFASLFVIRNHDGQWHLLMAKRSENKYMGGTWQLISGGIEAGETAWQAALRELREETGLAAREFYRMSETSSFYRVDVDAICTAIPFCVIVDRHAKVALNEENTSFAWHKLEDAMGQLMWRSDRDGLAEVEREIIRDGQSKPYLRIELPT